MFKLYTPPYNYALWTLSFTAVIEWPLRDQNNYFVTQILYLFSQSWTMSIEPSSIWSSGGSNYKHGPSHRSSQFLDDFYKNLDSR